MILRDKLTKYQHWLVLRNMVRVYIFRKLTAVKSCGRRLQYSEVNTNWCSQSTWCLTLRRTNAYNLFIKSHGEAMPSKGHAMETLPHYWPICAEKPPVTDGFPTLRANNVELRSVFFHCHEQAVEQSIYRWFETPWYSCNIKINN